MWRCEFVTPDGKLEWRNYKWFDEVQVRQIIKGLHKSKGWRNISMTKVY